MSFFNHHVTSICGSFVHHTRISWTSGRLCPSLFANSMRYHQVWITSSLHSRTTITSVESISVALQVQNWKISPILQQCSKPFPELTNLCLWIDGRTGANNFRFVLGWNRTSSAIRVELIRVLFPGLPELLCPPLTLSASTLTLLLFPVPAGTSHPRRWPPASRSFPLFFDTQDLALP